MGESLTGHVSTHDNPADICTKIVGGWWWTADKKRDHLVGLLLYDMPNVI